MVELEPEQCGCSCVRDAYSFQEEQDQCITSCKDTRGCGATVRHSATTLAELTAIPKVANVDSAVSYPYNTN